MFSGGSVSPVTAGEARAELRGEAIDLRRQAQVAQHRAGFHGGELILVAEQNHARVLRNGREQFRHQREIDHARFIHHHHVGREWIRRVMPEIGRAFANAQQPMNRARLRGQRGFDRLVAVEVQP